MLSFPPDLEIDRPSCARWDPLSASYLDEAVPAQARTALATALDLGGPRCATRAVQQLSGLAITGYVGMDIGAIERLAEAVRGIDICVRNPVLDGSLGPVVPDAGPVTLDAVHAADFARASDVQGDPPAGLGRIERQHALLAAVLDEGLAPTALLDVGRQAALRPALGGALVADGVALDEVAELSGSIGRPDADGLVAMAVPTSDGEQGAVTLRDPDATELFAAVRADAPLPARAPGSVTAGTGLEPADVTVAVVNASDQRGLATRVGETLRSLGFGLGEVGSAERGSADRDPLLPRPGRCRRAARGERALRDTGARSGRHRCAPAGARPVLRRRRPGPGRARRDPSRRARIQRGDHLPVTGLPDQRSPAVHPHMRIVGGRAITLGGCAPPTRSSSSNWPTAWR